MKVDIRRLQPGDEELALQVVRDLMPADERDGREPTLPHLQRLLANPTNYLIVAIAGGRPVAFLSAYQMPALASDASMVYLFEIEVAVTYRKQGIAKGMIQLLKTLCRQSDVEMIWVGTENENIVAKHLYASTGGVCEEEDSCEFVYRLTPTASA